MYMGESDPTGRNPDAAADFEKTVANLEQQADLRFPADEPAPSREHINQSEAERTEQANRATIESKYSHQVGEALGEALQADAKKESGEAFPKDTLIEDVIRKYDTVPGATELIDGSVTTDERNLVYALMMNTTNGEKLHEHKTAMAEADRLVFHQAVAVLARIKLTHDSVLHEVREKLRGGNAFDAKSALTAYVETTLGPDLETATRLGVVLERLRNKYVEHRNR